MKVEIEIYRGWSISFDTDQETFYCHSEQYDRDENKKSYSTTKKWIDDFIKDNEIFKPIWVESSPKRYGQKKIKLIGIRKDGRFVYEDAKGEKKQLSEYDEKDYILYDEANEKYKIEASKIDEQMEVLRLQRIKVLENVKGVELVDYKKQILGQK